MGTFMRNVEEIQSYITANLTFGSEEQVFKLMDIEKENSRRECMTKEHKQYGHYSELNRSN